MSKNDNVNEIIYRRMSESYLRYFEFDSNLSEDEMKKKMLQFVDDATKNGLYICVSHTQKLLENARLNLNQKDLNLAALFYATYFEHQVNDLITGVCNKKKVAEEDIIQILRDIPFRAKCSWLLKVLGLNPMPSNHLKVMTQIFEVRNSFVHYKWKGYNVDSDHDKKENLRITKILNEAEKSVQYLNRRINSQIHQDKKREAKAVIKSLGVK